MLRHTHSLFGRRPLLSPQLLGANLTLARRRWYHFDTHEFVKRLEKEGLNRAQAEGVMNAIAEVIDESMRNITSKMVTKATSEKVRVHCCYTWM
jgi:hypothetical protein